MNFTRRTSLILGSVLLAITLSGCIGLAATGAAVGVLAATDRRTLGAQTDDQAIELKAFGRIKEVVNNPGGVGVTSYNRKVLLTGQVLDAASRQNAERAIAAVPGVAQIHNELAVSGRASLGTNASDTLVTTKVKAAFVEAKDVQSNAIKVITEQGTAYLMGIVTQEEANRAAQVASRVSGVQRVVTVFEIMTADEMKKLESKAGK